jgi:hypothetical protein
MQLDFPALGPKLKLHLNKLPSESQTNPFAGLGVSQNNPITGLSASQPIPQVGTSKKTLLELPKANKANLNSVHMPIRVIRRIQC